MILCYLCAKKRRTLPFSTKLALCEGKIWRVRIQSETLSSIKKGRGIFYKFFKWQFSILVVMIILKKPEI